MRLRSLLFLSFLVPLINIANSALAQLTPVKVGHNGFSDSADDSIRRLRQAVHAKAGNFYAMYSSVLQGAPIPSETMTC